MKFKNFVLKGILFFSFLLYSPTLLWANVEVEVQLSDTTLFLGDEITAQLKVDGTQENVELSLPQIDGLMFRQLGRPSASSQTVIINGKKSSFSGLIYSIGISATIKGRYNIPGIEVIHDGQRYQSQGFEINVKEAGNQVRMKLILASSKSRIYVNEPVKITLKWYVQDDIEDYNFRFPLLADKDKLKLELSDSGKSNEVTDLSVDGFKVPFFKKTETLEGEVFGVYQVEFLIFPADPGVLNISPASVTVMVRAGTELKKDFVGRVVRTPKLTRAFSASTPLKLQVLPIPVENRPSTYSGGVGEFGMSITADNTLVKVGDPIELTIRITGEGRYETIEPPLLSEIQEFKDNFVVVDSLQPGDIKDNSIEFKQTIRPRHDDVTRIPPVEFSFFNPVTERFRTVKSNSIPLKVLTAGRLKKDEIVSYTDKPKTEVESFTRQKTGLYSNYLFEDALTSEKQEMYWVLLLFFPPAVYLVVLIMTNRYRRLKRDVSLVRAKSAKSKSNKRLKIARKLIGDQGNEFYLELSNTLRGYVGDKLNLGAGQFTPVDINTLVAEKKLSENCGASLNSILEEIDRYRFMQQQHGKADRQGLFERVSVLMKKLEKEI